ncbi:MAG TPA: prepilin-type N-terminal cleavage/methylation domain-containing protein, partial [Candidatus Hydrogenedentes bacterium]|nr:prepilin-type N-terminal cleavage/methylation domain-containing protein [Candidatus Hydrogenedentota bacterium]
MMRARSAYRGTDQGAAGLTLLELLVAVSILAVISGIVYMSLAGVTEATEAARADMEKLRLERFLHRHLVNLFGSVYVDAPCMRPDYVFLGTDGSGSDGPSDMVEFCSSAPLSGGLSLPGMLKRVIIEVE